jgi:hypothetical protein
MELVSTNLRRAYTSVRTLHELPKRYYESPITYPNRRFTLTYEVRLGTD